MSKTLREIVKEIQFKHNLTVEEVAFSIGYSRVHLTKEMAKTGGSLLTNMLLSKYKDVIQSIEGEDADKKITIDYEIESMVKDLLQVKAQVKTLLNHIARLEAREYKMEPDDVWDLLEADTKTNLRDLTRGS